MGDNARNGGLGGDVVERGAPGYESLRTGMTWSEITPGRFPDVIVRPASERDVQAAVALARDRGLRIAVRSGGHSWCGSPLRSDGLLLDLSRLRRRVLDETSATAIVQPAVTGGELVPELAAGGLAFPTGHCPTVGLGGYLLGGGLGWNSGALGPACRHVREAEVVTATGDVVRCSEDENPGLFWAVRGAGPGFFGVVTAFRLDLYPLPESVMSTSHAFPLAEAERVADWAGELAGTLAPEVELTLLLCTAGAGTTTRTPAPRVALLGATAFGNSAAEAALALEPLRECPFADRALTSTVNEPVSLPGLYEGSEQVWPARHRYAADNLWSAADLGTLVPPLVRALGRAPSGKSLVLIPVTPVAGSGDVTADMAFSALGETYAVPYAVWDDPAEDEANVHWLRETMGAMEPFTTGHYIAETDLTASAERARRSYTPAAWQRLGQLRAEHDPDGLFHSYLEP